MLDVRHHNYYYFNFYYYFSSQLYIVKGGGEGGDCRVDLLLILRQFNLDCSGTFPSWRIFTQSNFGNS
jgi:hypothetical protein